MKQLKKFQFLIATNKELRRALVLVSFIMLMILGVVAGMNVLQEKERVSAHPTNTIKLDEGGANEYEIPVDGQTKLEYQSGYDLFRQHDMNIPSLGKQLSETETAKTKLFSSQIRNYIYKSYITSNGNVISMQIFTTYPYGAGYNNINQTRIILQSRTGEVLDTKWVHETPNNINQSSGTRQVVYNSFFQKSGTEFMALYTTSSYNINTTTYVDNGTHLSISPSDNKRAVDTSSVNMKGQVIQGCWISNSGTNMSAPVIYPTSLDKNAYIHIEHSNGQVLNRFEFEASPDVAAEVHGSNSLNHAGIGNMYPINDTVVLGTENTSTEAGGVVYRISRWDINSTTKKASRTEIARFPDSSVSFQPSISDKNKIIAQVYRNSAVSETQVEIIEIDVTTSSIRTLRVFPKGTRFQFSKQGSGYFYAGQVSNIEGELENIGSQPGIYSGYMDADFNWKSSSSIQLDFPEEESIISISNFVGDEDLFVLSGSFATREINFIDEVIYGNFPGEISTGSNKEWSSQTLSPMKGNAFVSILRKTDDWTPLIKAPESFIVDLDDPAVHQQASLDRWLLTGSKNGAMTDSRATQVYDTMDIDKGLYLYDISWLRERINKNPNSLVYEADGTTLKSSDPIDWAKLGFNKNKSGPQLITYFVTDSQNQTSTTSTYINNVTDETVIDENDEFALDAKNFQVPLSSVATDVPDETTFKKLAKTMAWNLTKNGSSDGDHGNGLDEDGTDASKLSSKVTVDANQLKALREATVAKPYPVDVVYKPKAGVEIKNRVWVFVTTKNTIPNSETNPTVTPSDTNGLVYYADDYSLPFRLRGTQDKNEVLTRGNVKVYDYFDSTHETDAELPTLADASKNANKLTVDLPTIQNALQPGTVTPSVTYTWDGATDANHTAGTATMGYLDITLTGHTLWHVRQVVLDASTEIVVPSKSYFDIQNILDNSGSPTIDPDYQANLTANSGKAADNPTFTEVSIPTDHLANVNDQVQLSLVVPEFYNYAGYYCTTEQSDPMGTSHQSNTTYTAGNLQLSKYDLNNDGEFWITMYIKPNTDDEGSTKTPQPYSWDYEKNDLGKIKTK